MSSKDKPLLKETMKYSVLFGMAIFAVVVLKILFGGNFGDITAITLVKGTLLLVGVSVLFGFCGAVYEKYYGD